MTTVASDWSQANRSHGMLVAFGEFLNQYMLIGKMMQCRWIRTRESYGLLKGSFRPQADLVALRTLLRHRAQLVEHRAPHTQHMQKALLQMNIQLSQAVTEPSRWRKMTW